MSDAVKIFKALGNKTQYDIINVLSKNECCACKIPSLIGKTQPNTSMHLSKLLSLGIVKSRREGKSIIYSLDNNDVRKIVKTVEK